MPTSVKLPDFVTFIANATIEATADQKELPRFSMVAYSGGKMAIAGFPHPVVVDLSGLDIPGQSVPIRLNHKPAQGVGHSTRIEARDGRLIAEGLISRDTSWARDVARSGSNGFPWQASIGGPVLQAEFVPAGQTVEVNGRTFEGPIHVVRKMTLKEISFVDSGADRGAKAVVAAQAQENDSMPKTVDKSEEPAAKAAEQKDAASKMPTTPEKIEATDNPDPIRDLRTAAAEESRRIAGIRKICHDEYPEIEAKAIEEGWDLTRCELEVLRASRPKAPAAHVQNTAPSPQVFEAVALAASGAPVAVLEAAYPEQTLEAADRLRGIGVQEFCELACGMRLPRFRRDATGWLQAAFSTTSLPGILSNIANKALLEGRSPRSTTSRSTAGTG